MCVPMDLFFIALIVLVSVSALEDIKNSEDFPAPNLDTLHKDALGRSRRSSSESAATQSTVPTPNSLVQIHGEQLMTQRILKPLFTDCAKYQPLLKEEEPPGTLVLKVQATHAGPPESGGKITYSLLTPIVRNKFSIDSETGEIRTIHIYDHDQPVSEKEDYLLVKAADSRNPQLYDVCTFKITIADINDNEPIFDKVSHRVSVPQNLAPGKEVTRVSTTDIDEGKNALVHYTLEATDPKDAKYFRIDKTSGAIILDQSIDKDPDYIFQMQLNAMDQGDNLQPISADLEIMVVDSNKLPPTFKAVPDSPITVREDKTDFDSAIAVLTASSNDGSNPVFELVHGRTEETNKLSNFRLEVNGENAVIKLARPLDYESIPAYKLTLRVKNKYNLAADWTVRIQVEDVNDNVPTFLDVENGIVLANDPPGSYVMQVRAFDNDKSPEHNQVTYELADNKEYFAIDKNTGNITTLVSLDRKAQDTYRVTVRATDNSPSALSSNQPNMGEKVFTISVAEASSTTGQAMEKIAGMPSRPRRSLPSARSPAKLRHSRHLLGRGSPHLPTAEALVASNTYGINGENLVSSKNLDNHKPVFVNCSKYQPSVREEEPAGTPVIKVHATDRDPPENGGKITYTFVSAPNERLKFSIHPDTGEIQTRHTFDRDEPNREKEMYLIVRATDNGSPQLDDVCTIKVTIEDINDNTPVFDKVTYRESVPQDLLPGKEVMRISATDIDDGKNSLVYYELEPKNTDEAKYFHIEKTTGVIVLDQPIDKDPGYLFHMRATATDQGDVPNSFSTDLEISVVESNKKAPTFKSIPASPIRLDENLSDFDYNIATLTAMSNDDLLPVFELVHGRTEQTNKLSTFRMVSEGENAYIRLARPLDYESISEYTLTIRVKNKYSLAAETAIGIQVVDVNDNIPTFTELESGSVLENEPPGTPVMQVRAIDADSSPEHNQVTYELADNKEYFTIDKYTGNITTLVTFDREKQDSYRVTVYAMDNSPSALFSSNQPNRGQQVFTISIADKNDHPPKFTRERYVAEAIPEDANINSQVTEVNAEDKDTASPVTYSIVEGNIGDAFKIEPRTGKIRVNNKLDYENITSYTLKVRAFDGAYEDYAHVDIKIENVNDCPPQFKPYKNNITITEEQMHPGCIVVLQAEDPDIQDPTADQHIVYNVVAKQDQHKFLTIDKNGCLSLLKPLDRDPPNGYETWQVLIQATDNDGTSQTSLQATTTVNIRLNDINDNAPFLDMPGPVVWRENQEPGTITTLNAKDNDGPENGAPFKFAIANSADPEIQTKFGVMGNQLTALTKFDREEKKSYKVQIAITDNGLPPMTGTSTLTVIIGDVNDNPMKPGSSNIFVYNYLGEAPDTEIGRVYVEDLDDWDLPDKQFSWADSVSHPHFDLSRDTGMITMQQGTPPGSYLLHFQVTEESKIIKYHKVDANVNVTVKEIPEEAVDKSGSVRLSGISAEEFITPDSQGISKKAVLQARLAHLLNTSLDNVDVFTVLHSPHNPNTSQLDVRFSAHGSPYYPPEKINAAITEDRIELEKLLGVKLLMIAIDECLVEKLYCESSCINFLNKSKVPMAVYTNTTSFVGVKAVVDPYCTCDAKPPVICHNGGTPVGDTCECVPGFDGPYCEIAGVGFNGDGWALYPPFSSCDNSQLFLEIRTEKPNGLVFYLGPTNPDSLRLLGVQDFMSLELHDGFPVLLVDYGSGTVKLQQKQIKVADGEIHRIDILWSKSSIELQVDNCKMQSCFSLTAPQPPNEYLNVNGPLQVGGTHMKLAAVAEGMNWSHRPTEEGFSGCVRNLTFNGKLYNLGMPSLSKNADFGCSHRIAGAVTFGIDISFLVAILICLAILLILLLAVIVHRKKTDDLYKDTDDIRENIINYEDEGGGEGDMTGYDLNVLRLVSPDYTNDEKQTSNNSFIIPRTGQDDVPDICGFLDGKKQSVDNDPETNPFDDVRHYAYEGDGNTTGSLSSLASGTDEGDLNFDYLSNFGPRFRKLADMYGEDPSDEEDDNFHNAASESWC